MVAPKITKKDRDAVLEYEKRVKWILENADKGTFETREQRKHAIKRSKRDYRFMIKRYFGHIAEVESGDFQVDLANDVKRDIHFTGFAEWPRGHAKSVHCTIFIPFWLKINGQSNYLLEVSNTFDAAADLLDDLRAELDANPKIIQDFGNQKTINKKWERGYFITADGFIGRALGIGQKVRGLRVGKDRPDFIIIDDLETEEINASPVRQDAYVRWIERSLMPTMTGKYRRFLYSNNRWAKRMVQTVLQKLHPEWKVHHIKGFDPKTLEPIAWPEMYPREFWVVQVKKMGMIACQAEYNHVVHIKGKIFLTKYLRYDKIPRIDHFDSILAYWDPAYSDNETADTNAIRVWGRKGEYYYLIKSFVRHCEMDDAIEWMHLYQYTLPKSVTLRYYYERQFWNKSLEKIYIRIRKKWKKRGVVISLIRDDDRKGKKYDRIVKVLLPLYQLGLIIYNQKEESSDDFQEGLAQTQGIEPGYKNT
jgi:hypothetical protein